jgi:hypothetical protein
MLTLYMGRSYLDMIICVQCPRMTVLTSRILRFQKPEMIKNELNEWKGLPRLCA